MSSTWRLAILVYAFFEKTNALDIVPSSDQMPLDRCKGEIVNCYVSPCATSECAAYPNAICINDFCDGCNARFFDENDVEFVNELDCGKDIDVGKAPRIVAQADTDNSSTVKTNDDESDCIIAGCSGELCVSKDSDRPTDSVCEMKCEYGCKRFLECGKDSLGKCAWTASKEQNKDYANCLDSCATPMEAMQPMCMCTADYNPICCDGKQYSNPCNAECKGISKPAVEQEGCTMGECGQAKDTNTEVEEKPIPITRSEINMNQKECGCTKIYKPVCCSGQTYSNECMAACHGILPPVLSGRKCRRGACKDSL